MAVKEIIVCDFCEKVLLDKENFYTLEPEYNQYRMWSKKVWLNRLKAWHVCEDCFAERFHGRQTVMKDGI